MSGEIVKLDTDRWATPADIARWILTHADEIEFVTMVALKKDQILYTVTAPAANLIKVLGALEMARERRCDGTWAGYMPDEVS